MSQGIEGNYGVWSVGVATSGLSSLVEDSLSLDLASGTQRPLSMHLRMWYLASSSGIAAIVCCSRDFNRVQTTWSKPRFFLFLFSLFESLSDFFLSSFSDSLFEGLEFVVERLFVLHIGYLNPTKEGTNTSARIHVQLFG
ncbi:Protein of unknown function, partial [Cotesia congregata]